MNPDTEATADAATATQEAPAATPASEPASDQTPADTGAPEANPTASDVPAQPKTDQPSAIQQQPVPAQKPALDYEKQYRSLLPDYTRQSQARAELERRLQAYGDASPEQVRELLQRQQAQAEQQKLRPWHPKHPESAKTEQSLSRARAYAAAIKAAPEQAEAIAREMGVSNDDIKLYNDRRAYDAEIREEISRDPDAFVESRAERVVQRMLQQYEQTQSHRAAADQFVSQNGEILEKHKDAVLWAMQAESRRDVGIHFAKLLEENAALKAQIGESVQAKVTSQAQQAALSKRSTVRRDASSTPVQRDPVKIAQEKNIKVGTPAWFDLLREIKNSQPN